MSSELSSREHSFVTGFSKTPVPRASSCRGTFTRPVPVRVKRVPARFYLAENCEQVHIPVVRSRARCDRGKIVPKVVGIQISLLAAILVHLYVRVRFLHFFFRSSKTKGRIGKRNTYICIHIYSYSLVFFLGVPSLLRSFRR